LKIKYHDFTQVTRSHSFVAGVENFDTIFETVKMLLMSTDTEEVRIRLLGISISNFNMPSAFKASDEQLPLFDALDQ
jgi:DNA polymerase IV